MRVFPFCADRPPPSLAGAVASLPYDVVDTGEARALAAGNPRSFLRVVRPEIDLPDGIPLSDERVYARGARTLADFRREGTLRRDPRPTLYIYRLEDGAHAQTGVVATCHIDDYAQDVIRRHELTLPAKEDDRTRHVDTLNANTGPVFLTYRDHPPIDDLTHDLVSRPPDADFTAVDGVRHSVWRIEDPRPWVDAFAAVPTAYVADGHHRTASAVRVGVERRNRDPHHQGNEPYTRFLTVLFPADQLRILPYNRLVTHLNGFTPDGFLAALSDTGCRVTQEGASGEEVPSGRIDLYLAGAWHRLSWSDEPADDPVTALDVSRLQDRVLTPLLGIDDPRADDALRFVGGVHGARGLTEVVDSGVGAAAFALHPTGIDQLMAIADAGRIMPAKSTWFEPKLRSGLFVYPLEACGDEPGGA